MSSEEPSAAGLTSAVRRALVPILLAVVVLGTFGRSLRGDFVWDDTDLIVRNQHIASLANLGRALTTPFWDTSHTSAGWRGEDRWANVYYRPLVTLSFMLDYQLFGLRAWGYHLTNVLGHLLAVLLAWRLGRRLLGRDRPALALVAALVFATHPTRAEAVCWISGRSEVLMAIFFLLSLLLFVRLLEARDHGRPRRFLVHLGAWSAYLAALLCKETAVALALVVPAYGWLVLRARSTAGAVVLGDGAPSLPEPAGVRHNSPWRIDRMTAAVHLPLVAITLLLVVGRIALSDSLDRPGLDLAAWLTRFLASLGHYGALVIAPYEPNPMIGAVVAPAALTPWAVGGGLLLVGYCAVIAVAARRAPRLAWALVLAAAALAPASNLVPLRLVSLVAERFMYLPLLGLGLALAIALGSSGPLLRRALWTATLLLVGTWIATVIVRSADFVSPLRFWRAAVAAAPANPVARQELASALVGQRQLRQAELHQRRAIAEWRRYGEPVRLLEARLRLLDVRLLRVSDAERGFLEQARVFLRQLAQCAADEPPAACGAARVVRFVHNGLSLAVAVATPAQQQRLRRQRATLQAMLGAVESRLGNDRAAIAALEQATASGTSDPGDLMNLALVCGRALDLPRARRALDRAHWLMPHARAVEQLRLDLDQVERLLSSRGRTDRDSLAHHRALAEVYQLLRAPLRSARHLRRVIELTPDDRGAHAALAMRLAAMGDGAGALAVIERARQRFGSEPGLEQLEVRVRQIHGEWLAARADPVAK